MTVSREVEVEVRRLYYADFIAETLGRYQRLRATRLHDMLRGRGYTGSVRSLREYVAQVRPRPSREAFLRVEPLVGEQAQVDWAHVGQVKVPGGERALWLFVMVLSWSRGMWGEFVFDTRAHSLTRSLVRAAQYFGGTSRQWLFDNPKAVVLERHGEAVRFHPVLLEVAGHYRVQPRVCQVRKANQKGKGETAIRYLRERFLASRTVHSVEGGNRELWAFLEEVAHARPHPTQPGRSVAECLPRFPRARPERAAARPQWRGQDDAGPEPGPRRSPARLHRALRHPGQRPGRPAQAGVHARPRQAHAPLHPAGPADSR